MEIRGNGELLSSIDLAPDNIYQEVMQNIALILAAIQKSIPMLRGLGIPGELYGRPVSIAENLLVGEIRDQIETYEPRAIVGEITFERDEGKGILVPIVELMGVQDSEI
mgnify:CR=1 FL=1